MQKPPQQPKELKHLGMNALHRRIRGKFENVFDKRKNNKEIELADVLSSGFCIFCMKSPSVVQFSEEFRQSSKNLKSVFHIKRLPSDTAMRTILDEVNPEDIRPIFKDIFGVLQRGKQLDKFSYKVGKKKYFILSVDGSGHFSSTKVHGDCCLEKKSRSGKITYYHQLLGAALVNPNHKIVMPICPEPIIKQDGKTKNDCERNASKRLLNKFKEDHPHLQTIVVEDSLSSNEPHIKELQKHNLEFVLGAKKGNHKNLFKRYTQEQKQSSTTKHTVVEGAITHEFEFINQIPLNGEKGSKINFIDYRQKQKGKNDKHWTWATSLVITKENVYQIMRVGRSRWRIENETFNTLKNQGYNFGHNFGHGNKNLSTMFSFLMMLAFLVDQILQLCSKLFQKVLELKKSKIAIWSTVRGAFQWINCFSMQDVYEAIILNDFKKRMDSS